MHLGCARVRTGQRLHAAVHSGADRREAMFVDGADARLRVGSTAARSKLLTGADDGTAALHGDLSGSGAPLERVEQPSIRRGPSIRGGPAAERWRHQEACRFLSACGMRRAARPRACAHRRTAAAPPRRGAQRGTACTAPPPPRSPPASSGGRRRSSGRRRRRARRAPSRAAYTACRGHGRASGRRWRAGRWPRVYHAVYHAEEAWQRSRGAREAPRMGSLDVGTG
jgi:hypothetical protein